MDVANVVASAPKPVSNSASRWSKKLLGAATRPYLSGLVSHSNQGIESCGPPSELHCDATLASELFKQHPVNHLLQGEKKSASPFSGGPRHSSKEPCRVAIKLAAWNDIAGVVDDLLSQSLKGKAHFERCNQLGEKKKLRLLG